MRQLAADWWVGGDKWLMSWKRRQESGDKSTGYALNTETKTYVGKRMYPYVSKREKIGIQVGKKKKGDLGWNRVDHAYECTRGRIVSRQKGGGVADVLCRIFLDIQKTHEAQNGEMGCGRSCQSAG